MDDLMKLDFTMRSEIDFLFFDNEVLFDHPLEGLHNNMSEINQSIFCGYCR